MDSPTTKYERFPAEGNAASLESGGAVLGKKAQKPATFCVRKPLCGSARGVFCVRRTADRWGIGLSVAGVFLIVTALLAVGGVERAIQQQVDKQTIVTSDPRSEAYKTFQTSGANKGVKIRYAISWLNVTNPSEVLQGAAPRLVEMGPYVYHEHRYKHNISFSDSGDEATFVLEKRYVWDEDANGDSGRSDVADLVTTVHPVILILQRQLKSTLATQLETLLRRGPISRVPGLEHVLESSSLDGDALWELSLKTVLCQGNALGVSPFVTRPVRDIYWGYFDDPILRAMQVLVEGVRKLSQAVGVDIDLPVVPGAFPGLMVNTTSPADVARRVAPNVARTGHVQKGAMMQYVRFQGMDEVYACPDPTTGPAWNESLGQMPACYLFNASWTPQEAAAHGYVPQWASARTNQVTGTDGSMFHHPFGEDTITVFQEDYRRYVVMQKQAAALEYHGVKVHRYVTRWQDWQNCSTVPENEEYFQCNTPQGLTNLTLMGGFPLFLSKPHFLDCDPQLQSSVMGLSPSNDSHLNYIDVEPITGVTFDAHKRVQLNIFLEDTSFPHRSRHVVSAFLKLLGQQTPTRKLAQCLASTVDWKVNGQLYLPMVWYDEGFSQPESMTSSIKTQVYGAQKAARCYKVIGLVVGILALLVAVIAVVEVRRREAKRRREREALEAEGLYTALFGAGGAEQDEKEVDAEEKDAMGLDRPMATQDSLA